MKRASSTWATWKKRGQLAGGARQNLGVPAKSVVRKRGGRVVAEHVLPKRPRCRCLFVQEKCSVERAPDRKRVPCSSVPASRWSRTADNYQLFRLGIGQAGTRAGGCREDDMAASYSMSAAAHGGCPAGHAQSLACLEW